jgi:hypothetical protein
MKIVPGSLSDVETIHASGASMKNAPTSNAAWSRRRPIMNDGR